jgi:hypothetical protein
MEYYQVYQNRAVQTAAVITKFIPTLMVNGVDAAGLLAQSGALDGLAQKRNDALATADGAVNAESLGQTAIHDLVLSLPHVAEGELDDNVPAEAALVDLLTPVYAIVPRTTELALERGMKLKSALDKINAFLAVQTPVRPPVQSGGKGVADLNNLITAQPALEQAIEDTAAEVSSARTALRTAATNVDRLNKRFYAKLQSEARTNPALADALNQIDTESMNLPGTLGINSIVQGGTDQLHLLVNYDNASYAGTATNTIEWQVVGTDNDFTNSAAVDPSGNTLGPFAAGKTINVRTRVTNGNGTTTGGVRTIVMLAVGP